MTSDYLSGRILATATFLAASSIIYMLVKQSFEGYREPGLPPLPIVYWDADGADAVAAKRRPVLVEGSPALSWPAMTRWRSLDYIASAVPKLSDVFMIHGPFMYRDSSRPLRDDTTPPSSSDVPSAFVFENLAQGIAGAYYSRCLNGSLERKCDFSSLAHDLSARPFELADNARDLSWTREEWTQVWLHGGSLTNAHYDVKDNFFIQVRPGTFTPDVKIHLHPGQVLFLPAFTFHEVSSPVGDVSLGISIFNNCVECDSVALLRTSALPDCIRKAKNTADGLAFRVAAVAMLLRMFLGLVGESVAALVDRLTSLRFAPFQFESARCPQNGSLDRHSEMEIQSTARNLNEVIHGLASYHSSSYAPVDYISGVRSILLDNYVEHLSSSVVGPQNVARFLRCLPVSSAWQ